MFNWSVYNLIIFVANDKDNLNQETFSVSGSYKRIHNQLNCEKNFADVLFTFKPILNQIKATPFIRINLFENEMTNYIQKQLQSLGNYESDNVCHKKVKLSLHKSKNIVPENKTISINTNLCHSTLNNDEIKSFGQSIFTFFNNILKEKKSDIDEIMQKTYNYYLSISTLIKHMNKLENNNLHLNENNFKKMSLFTSKLPEIRLSNIFGSQDMNMFDLISNIDDEVDNKTVVESNTEIEDLPLVSKPAKRAEDYDIVRCICGITREEGKMIQCERCEVNLSLAVSFNFIFIIFLL